MSDHLRRNPSDPPKPQLTGPSRGSSGWQLDPIGCIRTPFVEKFGVPRQPVPEIFTLPCSVEIFPAFQPELSLSDLEAHHWIWILFGFHLHIETAHFQAKVLPPRQDSTDKKSVFATRSPHRPNHLGLSLVQIQQVTSTGLEISGMDAVDGTPVFDIKPFSRDFDDPNRLWENINNRQAGPATNQNRDSFHHPTYTKPWFETQTSLDTKSKVLWTKQAAKLIDAVSKLELTELLQLDPRPRQLRLETLEHGAQLKTHHLRYKNYDVSFLKPANDLCLVVDIQKLRVHLP